MSKSTQLLSVAVTVTRNGNDASSVLWRRKPFKALCRFLTINEDLGIKLSD